MSILKIRNFTLITKWGNLLAPIKRFYFGLRILLPIHIQLLEIENLKNPKIDTPYTPQGCFSRLSSTQKKL
jgi:hypothetical protein